MTPLRRIGAVPIPRPWESEGDFRRLQGLDLHETDAGQLERESRRVGQRRAGYKSRAPAESTNETSSRSAARGRGRDVSAHDSIIRSRPYVLPHPWASEEDYNRFHHFDLEGLTPLQRWAEYERARWALAAIISTGDDPLLRSAGGWPLSASAWLRERIERTRGERS